MKLVKERATAKFDETVEVSLNLGVDPRHADQMVRGVAQLPHGVGKPIRVMVFTSGEAISIAEGAGAAPLAALMRERDTMRGRKVGLILTGGNIDREVYLRVLGGG